MKATRQLIFYITLVLTTLVISNSAFACTCGVNCGGSCVTLGRGGTTLPDAGWRCPWAQNDPKGFTPFVAQTATVLMRTGKTQQVPIPAPPGFVTVYPNDAVPVWMWETTRWQFSNSLTFTGLTDFPAGDRAIAEALDAAMTTPNTYQTRNSNFWLGTHFRSSIPAQRLQEINSLTGISKNPSDPDGVGSMDQIFAGLCQRKSTYLSCSSSLIPQFGGHGACYKSQTAFAVVSPLNDFALRIMEGTVFVLLTQTVDYDAALGAYTYGDTAKVYFIKGTENPMGIAHASDATDVNVQLQDRFLQAYNTDMSWNFLLVNAADGRNSWGNIYSMNTRFKWSNGNISNHKFSFFQPENGNAREMILGYIGYDPIRFLGD